jgi:hypothetical protein
LPLFWKSGGGAFGRNQREKGDPFREASWGLAKLGRLRKSEIFELKQNIEDAEAKGDDPLGDLAQQVMQEVSARKIRLEAMRAQVA